VTVRVVRVKYGHDSAGRETKNCCAGEDQQQFNRPTDWAWVLMKPETKNDCAGESQEQFAGAAFRLFIIIV
jgi:hypothetical protein